MSMWFGGDYNPEQWPRETWDEDTVLMRRAGVNFATVGVFSWSRLEPREGEYDFEWLDVVLGKLHDAGVRVDLATATASPPPWLTHRYPEVLPVTEAGVRLAAGSRQHYCPSSPVYRQAAARLVSKLAERYAGHPALELWHVNNEYGAHVARCYCEESAAAFRRWLGERYGTVDTLNEAWGTDFWSQRYASFDEIHPPSLAPTFRNPAQVLDYRRFSSDELLACYRAEVAILRAASPGTPVTTNFMGFFADVDYWSWADEVDIVSDDSYPDPSDPQSPTYAAMTRDLMRSLGDGKPWLLMEQATSAVNWRPRNAPKGPGQMRAWSYQAIARGARGVAFFQWRQSCSGAEKFHSGMVPHAGTDSRVWREVESLGKELANAVPFAGGLLGRVGIVMDWDSWWSLDQDAMPASVAYVDGIFAWYRTLWNQNVHVDFVRASSDLSAFSVVIVPSAFALSEVDLVNLDRFAQSGGHLVVTFQSAITDERARVHSGGYLGRLRETLGIAVEEFAPTGHDSPVMITSPELGTRSGSTWAEYVRLSGANLVAAFAGGDLDGWPAITRNGSAWYVATLPDDEARHLLLAEVLGAAGISMRAAAPGLELVDRGDLEFAINHSAASVEPPPPHQGVLAPNGVSIVSKEARGSTSGAPRTNST